MSLVKDNRYIDQPKLSKTDKSGICIISEMPTYRIIGHLLKKHRVGLLATSNLVLIGYVVHIDKVVRLFI